MLAPAMSACAQDHNAVPIVPDHLREATPRTCAAWQGYLVLRVNMTLERENETDFSAIIDQNRGLQRYIREWLTADGSDPNTLFAEQPIVDDHFDDVYTIQKLIRILEKENEDRQSAAQIQRQTNYDVDSIYRICQENFG